MPAYPVFASYAQADRERYLEKFVTEFREELGGLLGKVDRAAVVFFDRDGLKAGDAFSPAILEALRHAQALVCLMSPTYLGREWCGRELEMFVRRIGGLQLPAGVAARFIFPIWWQMPATPRPLPARLSQFQYRDAEFPARYETLGAKGLARKRYWAQFDQLVDRLARLIAETLSGPHQLPPGEAVEDITQIANAFDEQQPLDVRMLALTTGGAAWRPGATDLTVGEAAAQAARNLQIFVRPVELGGGLDAGLKKAQSEQQVVLLVSDAATVADAVLMEINGMDLANLAVLLVDTGAPAVGADAWLARMPTGGLARARFAGTLRVAGSGALAAEMQVTIDEARRRLRSTQPAQRAEDAGLASRAHQQGIEIDVQPHLVGPGGGLTR